MYRFNKWLSTKLLDLAVRYRTRYPDPHPFLNDEHFGSGKARRK
jgi:hypothetical protein